MKNKNKLYTLAFAAMLCITALGMMHTDSIDATNEPTKFYTYSPTFISTATNAENVMWDFGDGVILDSRDAGTGEYDIILAANGGNVWAPRHTFPDNGTDPYRDYVVAQTVFNPFEGGSSDSFSSIIRIMGPPTITFMTNGGSDVATLEVPKSSNYVPQIASAPIDPVKEGYTFLGWFTDAELNNEFFWSTPVGEDIILYASWSMDAVDPVPGDEGSDGPQTGWAFFLFLFLMIIGFLLVVYGLLVRRNIWIVLTGVSIMLISGAIGYTMGDVRSFNDIMTGLRGIKL